MTDLSSLAAVLADHDEKTAHLLNALENLTLLRSTINDGLTGKNDLYLKISLLQDVEAVEVSLRKAAL
jgi:hypothetical protein